MLVLRGGTFTFREFSKRRNESCCRSHVRYGFERQFRLFEIRAILQGRDPGATPAVSVFGTVILYLEIEVLGNLARFALIPFP